MTLRQALTEATAQLAAQPQLQQTAQRDAELLLLHTLGLPRTALYSAPELPLTPGQLSLYRDALRRRLTLEPIQYITGTQEFYGLALAVTPAVLIPRPETELLVEAVLERLPRDRPVKIADVGTGSGAIALALATHLPLAEVTALDLSPEALTVARRNAHTHRLEPRVRLLHSNLLGAVAGERFDAVVANLPYVPTGDLPELHPQVADYEPHSALFAGPDGLDAYRQLLPQARAALGPGGLLALEFGQGQAAAVRDLLTDWYDILTLKDLQGIVRTCMAWRS
ncbi:MAG: peptide chain release factor N(5)-glutamine methyltransferase [Acidobacteriota bacterium]|nr:peptide chain release factor N(5)-glutamine methyltransferase [Acidobacteriota bacterium]